MAKRRALGRGLEALLPSDSPFGSPKPVEQAAGYVSEIAIDAIMRNPYQPRQDFDEDSLSALAHSIEQLGIIQPITVRSLGNQRFEVIAGERRLRAARRAGLKTIPAYVRIANSEEMLEMAIVENIQREQLNPIEIALGYRRLIEECGLKQEAVAQRVGKNRSTVANFLRLLRLPPRIQIALRDRTLSMGHARALLGLPHAEAQLRAFEAAVNKNLSVRQLEAYVRQQAQEPKKQRPLKLPAVQTMQIREFERSLRTRFGTKVQLSCDTSGKGKIQLHYYSVDDLERLLDLLMERPT